MFLSSLCSLFSCVPGSTDQTLILPNSNGIFLTFLLFTYLGVRARSHLSVGNDNQFHCLLSVTFQSSNLQNSSFWNGDTLRLRDGLQDYSLRLSMLFICSFNCYNIVWFSSSFWTLHSYMSRCGFSEIIVLLHAALKFEYELKFVPPKMLQTRKSIGPVRHLKFEL